MKLLLDTCTFLWYVTRDPKLPIGVADNIREPNNEAWLSVVSLWEIAVKHQLGRLDLPASPSAYIPQQRKRHLIASLPLEEAAVVHLVKLPSVHKDPFDRILVCQAIEHELTIVTPDSALQAYPVKTSWR